MQDYSHLEYLHSNLLLRTDNIGIIQSLNSSTTNFDGGGRGDATGGRILSRFSHGLEGILAMPVHGDLDPTTIFSNGHSHTVTSALHAAAVALDEHGTFATTPSPRPGEVDFSNLYPAVIECFVIIICGLVSVGSKYFVVIMFRFIFDPITVSFLIKQALEK